MLKNTIGMSLLLASSLFAAGCIISDDDDSDSSSDGGVFGSGGSSASGGNGQGGSRNTGPGQGGSSNGQGQGGSGTNPSGGSSSSTGGNGGSGEGGSSNPGDGEPPELAGITQAHNEARDGEGVGLPPMTWDPALAAIATAWGEACNTSSGVLIDHNPGRSDTYPEYVGENIYASTGSADPVGAVRSWMDEKPNYDFGSKSCLQGQCGHYTQVVWRDSVKLGCAKVNCPNVQFPSTIICNYAPGGNYNGQNPY